MRGSARRVAPRGILGCVADRNYRLIVKGELSDELKPAFQAPHGVQLTRAEGNTVLTGNLRDQAELQGLQRRVSDLGLTLLEAKRSTTESNVGPQMDPRRRREDVALPQAPRRHLV
jgi:hypothetical protein